MEEIGNTLPQEGPNTREPNMLDVDTTMDTTVKEDANPQDSTDHSHRVGKKGVLIIGSQHSTSFGVSKWVPVAPSNSTFQENLENLGIKKLLKQLSLSWDNAGANMESESGLTRRLRRNDIL